MTAPVLPAPHEFVSLSRAARAYPKRDSYVRRRLRELGLVNADGLVLWGQVVQAMSARGSACAVVPQPAIARSTDGDAEQDMGAKGWPRRITVDVVDGTQVRAQAMKSRGQKGDGRVYWKVRRYPGQAGLSVTAFTASGSGWATRPEMIQAINSAIVAELGAQEVPAADPFGSLVTGPDTSMTVAELVAMFLDKRERFETLSPHTLRIYRSAERGIVEGIGHMRVVDVTTAVLETFALRYMTDRGKPGKPLSPQSVRNLWNVLRPALQWAVETKRVPLAQAPKLPVMRYEPAKKSVPDRAVLRATFAWLAEHRPAVGRALRLQACLGTRIGELWGIRWRDIRRTKLPATGREPAREVVSVDVRGKTGARSIPANADALAIIAELREVVGGEPRDHVIGNGLAGRSGDSLSSRITDAFNSVPWHTIGDRWSPHALRRLFGNELIRTGISPPDYEAVMGHSFEVGMKYYLEARSGDTHGAVERMSVGGFLDVDVTPLHGAGGDEG